jgi:hypothetical protein
MRIVIDVATGEDLAYRALMVTGLMTAVLRGKLLHEISRSYTPEERSAIRQALGEMATDTKDRREALSCRALLLIHPDFDYLVGE